MSNIYAFTYPLSYMQKEIMDSQNFRQLKGKSVQDYTHEFRRRALILGINLYYQETLLKYIGGLHRYLRHTILMFNPVITLVILKLWDFGF